MDSPDSSRDQRIKERWRQLKEEAIRSRQFSQEELTRQAVEFLLFGLSIEKNRDDIIQGVRRTS